MEFIKFKISPIQELAFECAFVEILKDKKITCIQREFQRGAN